MRPVSSARLGVSAVALVIASSMGSMTLAQVAQPQQGAAANPAITGPVGQAGAAVPTSEAPAPDAPPPASSAAEASQPAVQEIVVTGTSLRGVAPVGSAVTVIGQKEIQATGAVSTSQLTNTVPAISTSGSAPQGENVYSFYSPQIHQLGGSASNSTLVIADGLRLPGGGTQYSETDPNIIPISAIERVEVLADGASSIYGSDAVAGVVNYITRKRYDGLQVDAQGGLGRQYSNYNADFLWGTSFENTDVVLAGQYSFQGRLDNKDRSFLRQGDYRNIGGSNFNSFNCSPATIGTPASGNTVYLSPSATSPVANVQPNAPCNLNGFGSALPSQRRENLFFRVSHEFSDRLRVQATMIYNQQRTNKPGTPGTISGVTAYGPGSGKGGQINPFFVAPAGEPGATQESISWVDFLSNDYGISRSEEDVFYGTFVATYKIGGDWTATFSDAAGKSRSSLEGINTFCTACAYLALNGTAQLSGSTTTSDIAGQNVIALNLPLTTANALDVWSPAGSNRTSAQVIKSLYATSTSNVNYNTFEQAKLEMQGTLFSLPAGNVKLAVGGEYYYSSLKQDIVQPDNTGPTTTGSQHRIYNFDRTVFSAYAEMVVPLIAPEMDIPLVRKFDLDLSGRYDRFNDVGDTANPKFAANWTVFDGVRIRANYSRSFVAPPMAVVGDPSQGYLYASGSVGQAADLFVPVSAYPQVSQIPGCAGVTTTCHIGLSNNPGMRRQLGGGFSNIKPETGNAWSIGVDLTPRFLPNFSANVTLFNNKFNGGATSPNPNSIVNSAGLRDQLTLCPSGCTAQQIATFANVANGATISGAVPPTVYFLIDQDSGNVLNLKIQGIDAQVNYVLPTDGLGTFRFGDALTYFTRFRQNFGGGPSFSILNTSGYNTTFPSIQFHMRANVGWDFGPVTADAFINYTGSYRNWSNTSVAPIIPDSHGNPAGGGDRVGSLTTVDLHVAYNFTDGFLKGDQIYFDGQNIFDRNPPFYNGNTSGILGGSYGFNGFVSNPIGRVLSVGFRAHF